MSRHTVTLFDSHSSSGLWDLAVHTDAQGFGFTLWHRRYLPLPAQSSSNLQHLRIPTITASLMLFILQKDLRQVHSLLAID